MRSAFGCALLLAGCLASSPGMAQSAPETTQVHASVAWIKPVGEPKVLNAFGGWINTIAFSADGSQVIADTDKTLFFLDLALKEAAKPIEGHRDMGDRSVLSPDAKRVYMASWATTTTSVNGKRKTTQGGDLSVAEWAARKKEDLMPLKKEVESFAVSADGKLLALGYGDGSFQLMDAFSGKSLLGPVKAYKGMAVGKQVVAPVTAIAFSPDGKRVLLGDVETLLRIFDTATGKPLGKPIPGHTSLVEALAFSPKGKYMVTATQDHGLFVLDGATGKMLGDRLDISSKATALAFSPDGKHVVTGHFAGDVQIWNFLLPE